MPASCPSLRHPHTTMRVLTSFLALAAAVVWGAKVPSLSFEKPFEDITSDGVRILSDDFTFGGHAVVNKHFVRLTSYTAKLRCSRTETCMAFA
ncbi:hypothetical protein DYB26_010495 [Aphanomyces astaci]|uniref:Uncharacterized protein n=1 Tax=Aphanomyces astaci TaxID=112090 RepID=A0A397FNQ5_APHAT|nr:hypothetical protein DYB36_009393 [Aphanomyces astaci]RHY54942.1 hypothetical protein DYB38_003108 [Aphanomyces astaci]RHZ06830.1 hypothetical protein DYB26_010495 [Aphanomyces astaci]RHZ34554.1 hypothetical protein DYB31_011414 [Aphanomyces astaci]